MLLNTRARGREPIWKNNDRNFLKLVKEKDTQVQEMQRVPNKMDPKRSTPRHIIIKMAKIKYKERILKATRVKQIVIYKGVPIRLSSDFYRKISTQKWLVWNIQGNEKKDLQPAYFIQQGYHLKLKEK